MAAGKGIALTHELTVVVRNHQLVSVPPAVGAAERALHAVAAARRATVRTG